MGVKSKAVPVSVISVVIDLDFVPVSPHVSDDVIGLD
jgi:hypothetical protein